MSDAPSLTWHRVPVEGRPASYLDVGTGRTALFLHGWGLSHRAYRASVKSLAAAGVRVLAPAMPGFSGTAGLPDQECTLAGYAKWAVDFLDAVGVRERVLLVGHSFGGGVAAVAAHDFPDRVGALVLVNAIGGAAWTRDGEMVRSMAERPLWDWGLHFSRDFRSAGQLSKVLPVMLAEAVPNLVLDPRAFLRSARLARSSDLTAELEALHRRGMPVVIVWSLRDEVVTEASVGALREALGDATAIEVDGGHNWLLSDPDQFGEVMTNVVAVAERAKWLDAGPLRRAARRVRARTRRRVRSQA